MKKTMNFCTLQNSKVSEERCASRVHKKSIPVNALLHPSCGRGSVRPCQNFLLNLIKKKMFLVHFLEFLSGWHGFFFLGRTTFFCPSLTICYPILFFSLVSELSLQNPFPLFQHFRCFCRDNLSFFQLDPENPSSNVTGSDVSVHLFFL